MIEEIQATIQNDQEPFLDHEFIMHLARHVSKRQEFNPDTLNIFSEILENLNQQAANPNATKIIWDEERILSFASLELDIAKIAKDIFNKYGDYLQTPEDREVDLRNIYRFHLPSFIPPPGGDPRHYARIATGIAFKMLPDLFYILQKGLPLPEAKLILFGLPTGISGSVSENFNKRLISGLNHLSDTYLHAILEKLNTLNFIPQTDRPIFFAFSLGTVLLDMFMSKLTDKKDGKIPKPLTEYESQLLQATPEVIAHAPTGTHEMWKLIRSVQVIGGYLLQIPVNLTDPLIRNDFTKTRRKGKPVIPDKEQMKLKYLSIALIVGHLIKGNSWHNHYEADIYHAEKCFMTTSKERQRKAHRMRKKNQETTDRYELDGKQRVRYVNTTHNMHHFDIEECLDMINMFFT